MYFVKKEASVLFLLMTAVSSDQHTLLQYLLVAHWGWVTFQEESARLQDLND
jgi:hypothetical protein